MTDKFTFDVANLRNFHFKANSTENNNQLPDLLYSERFRDVDSFNSEIIITRCLADT